MSEVKYIQNTIIFQKW